MIRIIRGCTRIGDRLCIAGSAPIEADAETEANLVARDVAEYVGEPPENSNPLSPEQSDAEPEETLEPETENDYASLSATELRALCEARGIPTKKNASAATMRAKLEEADADETEMPVLEAAAPVDA